MRVEAGRNREVLAREGLMNGPPHEAVWPVGAEQPGGGHGAIPEATVQPPGCRLMLPARAGISRTPAFTAAASSASSNTRRAITVSPGD